jgi:hypothetical protein
MKRAFIISHLCAGIIITIIIGLIYTTVQQNYRTNANDPQIRIAHDIGERLKQGRSIEILFPDDSIDIAHSLGVFAVLYDSKGRSIRSSASLDGNTPRLPAGVFDFVNIHGEDWVTWQPRPGVRLATVIISIKSSPVAYIAVGRSLQEVEVREGNLRSMIVLCWVICVVIVGIHAWLSFRGSSRKGDFSNR